MSEKASLDQLHEDGPHRAHAAAAILVGLRQEEALARTAGFPQGLTERKSASALSGFPGEEVRSREDGYISGMIERVGGWLS